MKQKLVPTIMVLFAIGAGGLQSAGAATTAPYGSWRSPITAKMLVAGTVRFNDVSLDGETLYWVEGRPEEEGRYVIVRRTPDGKVADVLPKPFSARSLVHEYGGGALLAADGVVYFTNYKDQRIWRLKPGGEPEAITAADTKLRFACYVHDAGHNRLIAVCEDHTASDQECKNSIVGVNLKDGTLTTLVEGADFYSWPQISPDGNQLAWISWNHPNMPWDDTELHVARFKGDGALEASQKIAGGDDESVLQPGWAPDGTLYFVSDRSNWWNLYAVRDGNVTPVLPMEAEFGVAHWVFGLDTYGFDNKGTLFARYTQGGDWHVVQIEPKTLKHEDLKLPYTVVSGINVSGEGRLFLTVGSPTEVDSLVELNPTTGKVTVIRRSTPMTPDPEYTSVPEAIEFPTDGGKTAHAFFYPPKNKNFVGPKGGAPPLIVIIHGGPTAATAGQFRLPIQYWTSRGFGVADVNYGGSTGYGREYRNRLRDGWGVVDVADATNAALYLASQGKADRNKLIIRGGSAGGYTTLACLAFRDVFSCGASYYGISDLGMLATDTHKFESHYLDRIVGLYPQEKQRYSDRSPLDHLDRFSEPIILLQGLEDKIVPPNQAEKILESLKAKGVPVAYVPFEGEQHGFRKAESIIRAQEVELYFYGKVLGFTPADAIEGVEIFNLPAK